MPHKSATFVAQINTNYCIYEKNEPMDSPDDGLSVRADRSGSAQHVY